MNCLASNGAIIKVRGENLLKSHALSDSLTYVIVGFIGPCTPIHMDLHAGGLSICESFK